MPAAAPRRRPRRPAARARRRRDGGHAFPYNARSSRIESTMQNRDRLYIDGRWTASTGAKAIAVVSPSTEETIGRVPEGTAEDVDAAAAAARGAFERWS